MERMWNMRLVSSSLVAFVILNGQTTHAGNGSGCPPSNHSHLSQCSIYVLPPLDDEIVVHFAMTLVLHRELFDFECYLGLHSYFS